ncbi:hypothetical protein GCM10009720_09070 [Yaniella flava]|uniref:DNA-binding phage zinc finger domain-containing protein n=2 Tax=Yaniella flava TaxID=287930 RepID=A0ABN2U778_9MICC
MSGLPTVNSVPCPTCGAKPGARCTSRPSGGQTTQPHSARSKAFRSRLRKGSRFVALMRRDDPEHGLKKGEKYLAQALWTQPNAVKLIQRLPGGRKVNCLQYDTAVRFIKWEI